MKGVKKLDLFRRMPKDLTEPTLSGATVSMICTVIISFLVVTEFMRYLDVNMTTDMVFDEKNHEEMLQINIDFAFHHAPCHFLSLDAQDILGNHQMNLATNLKKIRLNQGKLHAIIDDPLPADRQQYKEEALKAIQNGEGCRMVGFVTLKKVPGNFHISTHAYGDVVEHILRSNKELNFQFQILHLSFGDRDQLNNVMTRVKRAGVFNPLDNTGYTQVENIPQGYSSVINFYMSAVSAVVKEQNGRVHRAYQFTASNDRGYHMYRSQPAAYFRFEISPITLIYKLERENFLQFLVYICAIVGGIYTISGIVDSILHKSMLIVFKDKIGKLS